MATPGIIPRYPPLKGGWYAPWDPFSQLVGIIPPFPPPPTGAGGQEAFAPVFFTAADETKSIFWPNPETIPQFQVFVYNELTGEPEIGGTSMYADESYPDTVKYTYQNAGAYGYISITGVIEVSKLTVLQTEETNPPSTDEPVSISGAPSLPDASVDVAYNYSIIVNGTTPITLSAITAPAWMTVAISGNLVSFTGTPTATATGVTVEFTVDNDFGDPVTFTDTIDVNDNPPPPPPIVSTKFGAIIGTDQAVAAKVSVVKDLMGLNYYRGARELLSQYTGQGSNTYNVCKSKGVKMLLNANWQAPPGAVFATNETLYKSKLNLLLDNYGGDDSVVEMIVIENEPDNAGYYSDSAANYIRQLGWAIDVIHARGLKVADGCLHILGILADSGFANQVMTGINNLRISGKALDYINIHTNLTASANARKFIESAAIYKARTGIPNVMSNEWHIESSDNAQVIQAMRDCVTAGYHYCIPFGGDCPWVTSPKVKAYPFNCGYTTNTTGTLNAMGVAIKNEAAGFLP